MNKKGYFLTIGGVLALSIVLLITFQSSAFSDDVIKKSSKFIEVETTLKDLAIKTFDININNVKVLYHRDVFNDKVTKESADLRSRLSSALAMLTDDKIFVPGDKIPIYFLEGSNMASIAIKHVDWTVSLTKFDISETEPVKINHIVKEAK
ncbi:hypothetical protein [Syntrophobotulus glycolicus]|nr:hypothetical protein [Syntrophobotulus glycolicus]